MKTYRVQTATNQSLDVDADSMKYDSTANRYSFYQSGELVAAFSGVVSVYESGAVAPVEE